MNIQNGLWNSSEWNKKNNPIVTLDGRWEFYWQQLLYEEDFKQNASLNSVVNVPSVWNDYKIHGKKLPGFGYATFRLHVVNAKVGKPLAIMISPLATSYHMYINQKLVATCGEVGTNKGTATPEYKLVVLQFTPESSSYDIIMQVTNFTHARGGMWFAPQIGTAENILHLRDKIWFRDIFLFGSFVFMLFFSGCLYIFQKDLKRNFYFCLLCTCIIIRTLVYGSYLITSWSFLSNLNMMVRLDYLSLCWFTPTLLLLVNNQFPIIVSAKKIKVIYIYAFLFSFFVICTPISVFTKSTYILEIVTILAFLYIFIMVIWKFMRGMKGTFLLLSSLIILYISGFHDLLLQNNNIAGESVEMIPIGFFLLLICEEFLIAQKLSDTILENEKTFFEIEEISERERKITLKFLKSQIKPHFIHNALNTIISISRKDTDKARDLLVHFNKYLRSCFDFGELDSLIPLERELDLVYSYVSIEKARFGDYLNVKYEIDDIDYMVPPFLLQPLVENAIDNGVRKSLNVGEITIYIRKLEQELIIGVRNNGTEIEKYKQDAIYDNTENEGTGLSCINQKLNKIYKTSLMIEAIPTGGNDIYMKLPLDGRKG